MAKMIKLEYIKNGEWIKPKMKGFLHECCGCGLRHTIDFKVFYDDKKNPIDMRFKKTKR